MPWPEATDPDVRVTFASKFIKVKQSCLCGAEGKLCFAVFTLDDPVWTL